VGEAFVVAKVEVGFSAIVGDKDFPVLERRHGAGIDVEVGIELHQVHGQPAAFEEAANGGRRQTLPNEDTTPPVTKMYFADIFSSP